MEIESPGGRYITAYLKVILVHLGAIIAEKAPEREHTLQKDVCFLYQHSAHSFFPSLSHLILFKQSCIWKYMQMLMRGGNDIL